MTAAGSDRDGTGAARPSAVLNVSRVRSSRDGIRESEGSLSPELDALADRVGRLRPSHRDPERFHVEKDEIERALRRLARRQVAG